MKRREALGLLAMFAICAVIYCLPELPRMATLSAPQPVFCEVEVGKNTPRYATNENFVRFKNCTIPARPQTP